MPNFFFLSVWRNLGSRRALARLRSYYPSLFYLPGLLFGQLLSYWLPSRAAFVAAMLVLSIGFWRANSSRAGLGAVLLLSCGVGILSMWAAFPSLLPKEPAGMHVLEVRVDQPPRYRRIGEVEVSLLVLALPGRASVREEGVGLLGSRLLCRAVDLPWRNISQIGEGSELVLKASLRSIQKSVNPFSYEATLLRRGYIATCRIQYAARPHRQSPPLWYRIRRGLAQRVVAGLGDNEKTGLLLSMGIGLRDRLSDRTETAFKRTGLAHLLVVSGYQVTLVYYALLGVVQFCLVRIRWLVRMVYVPALARACALVLGLGFVALVGVEGSSLRAALAIIFVVIARNFERAGGMLNSIIVSLLVISLIWPGSYLEPGLQLTYAALFGLCLGLSCRGSVFGQYLRACIYASLFTSFVVLCWFGQLSLVGFLLNPLVAPLAAALSCKGGFLALAAYLSGCDPGAKLLGLVATALGWFRDAVLWLSAWEYAAAEPVGWGLAITLSAIALISVRTAWARYVEFLLEEGLFS